MLLKKTPIREKTGNKISDKDKLVWLFKLLLKEKTIPNYGKVIDIKNLIAKSYFFAPDIEQELDELIKPIQEDKDFYRKHSMQNYKPDFTLSDKMKDSSIGHAVVFTDFTDDFIERYLKYKFDLRLNNNEVNSKTIEKIEILDDKNEQGRIKVYINGNYENEPMDFSRNKKWGKMYELAKKQEVPFEKSFYDYFNYQQTNPLYTNGFKITKILKEQDGSIVPNIKIKILTPNKITRQLKSA